MTRPTVYGYPPRWKLVWCIEVLRDGQVMSRRSVVSAEIAWAQIEAREKGIEAHG